MRRNVIQLFLGAILLAWFGVHPGWAATEPPAEPRFPVTPFVVDVKSPPYSARGDGVTDDTEALQRALNENVGQHRVLYFPAGEYLVSRTLTWPKKWADHENWGFTRLSGQHRDRSIIRLRNGTFTNASQPAAIMWSGGFGSADWFHNYVEDLTFDVGTNNPGATALQFYANNSGAVRNCRFRAPAGIGFVGLDLAHRDLNGPLLVQNCEITGFRRGVATGHAVNSQTFEYLTLRGQTEFGFDNEGQAISLRRLTSDNAVPAIRSYGVLTLLEANLTGRDGASNAPAVINYNGGRVWARDVTTSGYGRALADVATPDFLAAYRVRGTGQPGSRGPDINEYCSHPVTSPFGGVGRSLRLPVKEPPALPPDDPANWADVDRFGADPHGVADSSAAIQRAVDSGATTVFLPGSYRLQSTIILRGAVRRLVGLDGMINYGTGAKPDFRLGEGPSPVFEFTHFSYVGGGLEIDTRRPVILRSVSDASLEFTARAKGGELFLEDCVTHALECRGQNVWARQLNIENEGDHLINAGGTLWVLGYKTERGGTLLASRDGARSEILGNFSYTTTAGKLAPMFRTEDATVFAFFGEVCFNGDRFAVIIRESHRGNTREIRRGEGSSTPYGTGLAESAR